MSRKNKSYSYELEIQAVQSYPNVWIKKQTKLENPFGSGVSIHFSRL
jgi:hypothetical protein